MLQHRINTNSQSVFHPLCYKSEPFEECRKRRRGPQVRTFGSNSRGCHQLLHVHETLCQLQERVQLHS